MRTPLLPPVPAAGALVVAACVPFDPMTTAGRASTAIRIARDTCSMTWAKPVPDETHWGAQLVGDTWHIWLRDGGGTSRCALGMVTVNRRNGVTSRCEVCSTF